MSHYFGVFNGANYPSGSIHERSHVEILWNLQHAAESLKERYTDGHFHGVRIRRLDTNGSVSEQTLMPGVIGGDTLTLYTVSYDEPSFQAAYDRLIADGDPYPDYIFTLTDRGGVRQEKIA